MINTNRRLSSLLAGWRAQEGLFGMDVQDDDADEFELLDFDEVQDAYTKAQGTNAKECRSRPRRTVRQLAPTVRKSQCTMPLVACTEAVPHLFGGQRP